MTTDPKNPQLWVPASFADSRRQPLDAAQAKKPDMREIGISGTKIFAGIVSEEVVPQLQGFNAYRTYSGMRMDATGSAILQSIALPIRSSRWYVDPASDSEQDVTMADFIHSQLFEFGSMGFDESIRLALGCLWAGFSAMELIYRYIDSGPFKGKIGWDSFQWRSPATKWRWQLEWVNNRRQLTAMIQLAPPRYQTVPIPRNKLLLFVNDQEGDDWDGVSLLRYAWKDYFFRDALYRIRAIGLERGYMGIPIASVPTEYTDRQIQAAQQIVQTLRVDEQAGVVKTEDIALQVLHNALNGTEMDNAIHYHNRQMLMAALAQFLDLGAGGTGTYALSSDQSELFLYAITAKANYVSDVLNHDPGVAQLIRFNYPNVTPDHYPKVQHGDIGQRSLDKLGRSLMALGAYGFLTPDDQTEDRLRQMLDLPEREAAITPEALMDLVQQIFPVDVERGRVHPGGRLPSPLEIQEQLAQAKGALPPGKQGQQQALQQLSQGGRQLARQTAVANRSNTTRQRGLPPTAIAARARRQAQMGENPDSEVVAESFQMAENRARLAEMFTRMAWRRPEGRRLTDSERRSVDATMSFAEELDEMKRSTNHIPEKPSRRIARLRRAYEVRRDWVRGAEEALEFAGHGGGRGNAQALRDYWTTGVGAAKIGWGAGHDFDRCVSLLSRYLADARGYCALRHRAALGAWPGHAPGERWGSK